MPRPTPYFGVAGVTDIAQAGYLRDVRRASPSHITCIGVLGSLTTLEGTEAKLRPRYPARYPTRDRWSAIFSEAGPSTVRLLHYNGPNDETLPAQLAGVMHWAGPLCGGVQLNIAWPSPDTVHGFRVSYPDKAVVLQLSAKALRMAGDDPANVVRMVRTYGSDIDYVLLDPSGGTGTALTEELAVRYLDALHDAFGSRLGLGAAGGFGPNTTMVAEQLLKRYPHLSVDAEGKLRDDEDRLDTRQATRYLDVLYRTTEPAL